MLRSMTAFARGQSSAENYDFLVEIHSVNSRRLETVVNMPGPLTEFDPPLRKLIARAISRGRVSVYVSCEPAYDRGTVLRLNTEMAKQIKNAYDELSEVLGYDEEVNFSIIASRPDLVVPANPPLDSKERWEAIKTAAESALARLLAMKETEGRNLRSSFDNCLAELRKAITSIEELAPSMIQRHTERLRERVKQAASDLPDNEDRILREIVIFADKLDLSEEIARIHSHIAQFRTLIDDDTKPCGRTLDFLVQEMNREFNTIGARADDLAISRLVVHAKTELEKLREQAQNIE